LKIHFSLLQQQHFENAAVRGFPPHLRNLQSRQFVSQEYAFLAMKGGHNDT
jgi:hypothetical protein